MKIGPTKCNGKKRGSVIGPILFIIYVYDMMFIEHNLSDSISPIEYANDICL